MYIGDIVKVVKLYEGDKLVKLGDTGIIKNDMFINDGTADDIFYIEFYRDIKDDRIKDMNLKHDGTYTMYRDQLEVIE